MPDGQFESLRLELLRSGVTPLYVERTILELEEHYADLESAGLRVPARRRRGSPQRANAALGKKGELLAAILPSIRSS